MWYLKKKLGLVRAQNVPKVAPKWGFLSFDINLIHSYVLCKLNMKVIMVFKLSAKATCLWKSGSWVMVLKPPDWPIRMENSLNCNISQICWVMKLHFLCDETSIEATILPCHFKRTWSCITGHAQSFAKSELGSPQEWVES